MLKSRRPHEQNVGIELNFAMEQAIAAFFEQTNQQLKKVDLAKRTKKKLEKAYDQLQDYGFSQKLISQSLAETNDLEAALRWLCWHCPSDELPARFAADKTTAVDQVNKSQQQQLNVIRVEAKAPRERTPRTERVLEKETPSPEAKQPQEKANDESKDIERDWIKNYVMQQQKREEKEQEQKRKEKKMTIQEKYVMERTKLDELMEKAAKAKQAKDKLTQKKIGKEVADQRKIMYALYQQIPSDDPVLQSTQAKQSTEKVQQKEEQEEEDEGLSIFAQADDDDEDQGEFSMFAEEDEEEGAGGLMTMFDDEEYMDAPIAEADRASAAHLSKVETNNKRKHRSKNIKKAVWTGQVPDKYLEQWCQKRKLRRPKYDPLPSTTGGKHRFIVKISTKPKPLLCSTEESYPSKDEAREAVANRALYELLPDQSLYQLFAPVHREKWLSWIKEKEDNARSMENAEKRLKQDIIDDIYNLAFAATQSGNANKDEVRDLSSKSMQENEGQINLNEFQFDDWEAEFADDTSEVAPSIEVEPQALHEPNDPIEVTSDGRRLQKVIQDREKTEAYTKFISDRNQLPIARAREEVLKSLRENPVIVISGSTGCGKTTQIPHFLLQEALHSGYGDRCNIICTQPRRIAAKSVAARVADELGEVVGAKNSLVGYQVRMDSAMSLTTRLSFCTTGILLRRLQDDPYLSGVSHVIVDEVHERDIQCDFLLTVLRKLAVASEQKKRESSLKIILMSATLDADKFSRYFGNCPVTTVPGRLFPVKEYYLEDAIELTQHIIDENSRNAIRDEYVVESASVNVTQQGGRSIRQRVSWTVESEAGTGAFDEDEEYASKYSKLTCKSMNKLDPSIINFELIEDLLLKLCSSPVQTPSVEEDRIRKGAILIFMPGFAEIQALVDLLLANRLFGDESKFWILPLHSSIASDDQQQVFVRPASGIIKIVVSSNIAETSVTIPDVTRVIDTGRVKQMTHSTRRKMNSLDEVWTNRASAKQRMGRAGRVTSGVCYHLYPRYVERRHMPEHGTPEMQRAPLIDLCLQVKVYGYGSCQSFLRTALDPPTLESINDAIEELREIGALTGNEHDGEGELTALGKHLSILPVNVKVGKLLIYGALFRCVDPVLTVACIMESRSPFVAPYGKQKEAAAARKAFVIQDSDLLTDVNAFKQWQQARTAGNKAEKRFCQKYFIHRATMYDIQRMKSQFQKLLQSLGFLPPAKGDTQMDPNQFSDNWDVVSALLGAGLYPNVLYRGNTLDGRGRLSFWDRKQQVFVHPSSINAHQNMISTPWLGYLEKVNTSRVFVRQTTPVSSYAIVLFGGNMSYDIANSVVIIDEWITMQCSGRAAVLLGELRVVLNELLEKKIDSPELNLSTTGNQVVELVVQLLLQAQPVSCVGS